MDKMPAVSQNQQKFMAICQHNPGAAKGKCPSKAVAKEYAATKRKGLPKRVKK
jgi:hypothetical protein